MPKKKTLSQQIKEVKHRRDMSVGNAKGSFAGARELKEGKDKVVNKYNKQLKELQSKQTKKKAKKAVARHKRAKSGR